MQQAIIDQMPYHPPCDPQKETQERSQNPIRQADGGPANPQAATGRQQSQQPEQTSTVLEQTSTVLQKPNTLIVQWDDWNVDTDHETAERIYNNIQVEDPDK